MVWDVALKHDFGPLDLCVNLFDVSCVRPFHFSVHDTFRLLVYPLGKYLDLNVTRYETLISITLYLRRYVRLSLLDGGGITTYFPFLS